MKRFLVPIVAERGSPRRGRRIALLLTAAVFVLAFAGAYLFARFGAQLARDPGLTSRNARVLSKLLEQGRLAEARGDQASAADRLSVHSLGGRRGRHDAADVH